MVKKISILLVGLFIILSLSLSVSARYGPNAGAGYTPDVNVIRIEGTSDTRPFNPIFSYAEDGNLTIDLNILDLDSNYLYLDLNISGQDANGTGIVALNDFNLSSFCNADMNFFASPGGWDNNYPLTCQVDVNISPTLLTTGDGNYFIIARIFDGNATLGPIQKDINADLNISDDNFLVDNTVPTTSISNPSNGSSNYALSTTVSYAFADNNTSQKNSWVSTDNASWTSNGINTSYTFNISTGVTLPYTIVYYIKVSDQADNNSTVSSVQVIYMASGGGPEAVVEEEPQEEEEQSEDQSDEETADQPDGQKQPPSVDEQISCSDISCPSRPCAVGVCNQRTLTCDYAFKQNGTSCGFNKVCSQGVCIQSDTGVDIEIIEPTGPAGLPMNTIIVVIGILIVVGIAYYFVGMKK